MGASGFSAHTAMPDDNKSNGRNLSMIMGSLLDAFDGRRKEIYSG
jgi:hypothetical protein